MRKREPLDGFVREQLHKHGMLLESLKDQSRSVFEAVQTFHKVLAEKIDRCIQESREHTKVLKVALGVTSTDVRGLRQL